jgi:hypothetical protein
MDMMPSATPLLFLCKSEGYHKVGISASFIYILHLEARI